MSNQPVCSIFSSIAGSSCAAKEKFQNQLLNKISQLCMTLSFNKIQWQILSQNWKNFKTRMPAFPTAIQHFTGSFSQSNQIRKRYERHTNWSRKSKTRSICRDSKIFSVLYRKFQRIPKKAVNRKTNLAQVHFVSSMHNKSVLFLYQQFKQEIKKAFSLIIASEGVKYLNQGGERLTH